MNAEDRQRVKAALDAHQRERVARENMTARYGEREARRMAEREELPQAAEHVPSLTERDLHQLPGAEPPEVMPMRFWTTRPL